MNDDFQELYEQRQKREECRHNNKQAIIALIAAIVIIVLGLLAAHYDATYDTSSGIEMFAIGIVLFVYLITHIRL